MIFKIFLIQSVTVKILGQSMTKTVFGTPTQINMWQYIRLIFGDQYMHEQDADEQCSMTRYKALVVHLIINGNSEEALKLLADHYHTSLPRIQVGIPRRHRTKAMGCYTAKNQTISVLNSETLKEPSIILHEFYHHLRTSVDKKHRGTEKYASNFARDFILAYEILIKIKSNQ